MAESVRDILRNNIKAKLARDEVVFSMTVRLTENIEIARLVEASGYDSLYVDMEHSGLSFATTARICIAALEAGVTPLVRVPGIGPESVSRIMDIGAMGVIAPQIRSREDAMRLVANAKFPPLGERSVTLGLPQFRARQWPLREARDTMNEMTTVVAMVETKSALECVGDIASVDGVDILFIGTNDLCADLGIDGQFDHPLVKDAYKRTIDACRKHGKHVGIGGLAGSPDLIAEFVEAGARFISVGADFNFLALGARNRLNAVKEALGHKGTKGA